MTPKDTDRPAEIDWNSDEQVVRGAHSAAYCRFVEGPGRMCVFSKRTKGKLLLGKGFSESEAWKDARTHESVQAFEKLHRPAAPVATVGAPEQVNPMYELCAECGHKHGHHCYKGGPASIDNCGHSCFQGCACPEFVPSGRYWQEPAAVPVATETASPSPQRQSERQEFEAWYSSTNNKNWFSNKPITLKDLHDTAMYAWQARAALDGRQPAQTDERVWRHLVKWMYDECGSEKAGDFIRRVEAGEHDVPSPWPQSWLAPSEPVPNAAPLPQDENADDWTCSHCSRDMRKMRIGDRCLNEGLCVSIADYESRKAASPASHPAPELPRPRLQRAIIQGFSTNFYHRVEADAYMDALESQLRQHEAMEQLHLARLKKAEGEVTHMRIGWGDFLKQFGIVASVGAPGGFVNERAETAEKELDASPTLWLNRALEEVKDVQLHKGLPWKLPATIRDAEAAIQRLIDSTRRNND